jgi:hypothetical protein
MRQIAVCRPHATIPLRPSPAPTRLAVLVAVLTASMALPASANSATAPFDRQHFLAAMRDAAVPGPADVDTHLFALSDANRQLIWRTDSGRRQVAVTSVMTRDVYTKYYARGSGTTPPAPLYGLKANAMVWVTLAPELRRWCRRYARRLARAGARNPARRVRRRVAQRLGLDPRVRYARVVEMWVDPANVFRPCPDPGVADRSCELRLTDAQVKGIDDYAAFFTWLYYTSYSATGAPWTRLGYTYDWGGHGKFGASEYILTASTPWQARSAAGLYDYCH